MNWAAGLGLGAESLRALAALPVLALPRGQVLFRPRDRAQGFVVVLSGRVEVGLTGPSGREILLYTVEPGQSCVQTTLGLMGDEPYTGEAVVAEDSRAVMITRTTFDRLVDEDPAFRRFVMTALGRRMQDVTRLLERVAFGRVESRLAEALIDLARDGQVQATQAELAARIGTAREVVTRRLDGFVRAGWVSTDRGTVTVLDRAALQDLARDVT